MKTSRRRFFKSLTVATIAILAGSKEVIGQWKYGIGRWWHGRPGDIRLLSSHMMSSKHRIPRQHLVGMSYQAIEQWHEVDHRRFGAIPSKFGLNRHDVKLRSNVTRPRVATITPKKSWQAKPKTYKQSKKRLYVIDNKLVFK